MERTLALSQATLDLAHALHEAAWRYLDEQLTTEQRELARDIEGCHLYAGLADGSIRTTDYVRRDAPYSLLTTIADTLARLPQDRWPDQAQLYAENAPLALEALQMIAAQVEQRREAGHGQA